MVIGHSEGARRTIPYRRSRYSDHIRKVTTMDINGFIEPFQQFGQHIQQAPQQAQEFVEQHAPKLPEFRSSILGS
ncbi:hypothetical protein A606_00405 [Corynebacterium terpenotabidum Y-11]|uniref:Uncharacterized protein n=1 Tax=Corynebacterium terpenotabidum Y-11 TaxID=1200352 RepID=S4XAT3_9CORY|nr:hypothetical protein A606_00405 [Corynebacterium terpenotabidum Y-11]